VSVSVAPHEFVPQGRVLGRDRCRACYRTKDEHPTTRYMPARHMHDKQPAKRLSAFFCGLCTDADIGRCHNVGCPGFRS